MQAPPEVIADVIRWLQAAKIDAGAVFRRIGKGDQVASAPLTTTGVRLRLAAYDYGARNYTPRSLRKGFAIDLAQRGKTLSELRSQLRLRSIVCTARLAGAETPLVRPR